MAKKELLDRLRSEGDGTTLKMVADVLEAYIADCHRDNETNRGDDVLVTQGEIKGHRKLLGSILRTKK